jgi:arsenite methyltransferase
MDMFEEKRLFKNSYKDKYENKDIASIYDELPLWASPFGLMLLDKIEYKNSIYALDLCCGTGFPTLEVAQRLGATSKVFGLDMWEAALERARYKAEISELHNIEFFYGDANHIPFPGEMFDLVISNNGINNTGDELQTLKESFRVLKDGGQLVFTFNLPGSMKEFYDVYKAVLIEEGLERYLSKIDEHIYAHRKPVDLFAKHIKEAGFNIQSVDEERFNLRFASGKALFGHHFVRLSFLKRWIEVLGDGDVERIFGLLEGKLDDIAEKNNGLCLSIPFVCFSCRKP